MPKEKRYKAKQAWLAKLNRAITQMQFRLKREELVGCQNCGTEVAELLRGFIAKGHFSHVCQLMDLVRSTGRQLTSACPHELAIGNITRRILSIIRSEVKASVELTKSDDFYNDDRKLSFGRQLTTLFDEKNNCDENESTKIEFNPLLKGTINQEITLLINEIKISVKDIADQACEHIYAKEVIMTFGHSRTVLGFLQAASVTRKFEVLVAESAPKFYGQKMASDLGEIGIEATVISDAAVFAMMTHANKVIIGPHCVLANGGLIARAGTHGIALAAKYHSVPVVILTGMHKISPLYAFDMDTFNVRMSPGEMISFEEVFLKDVEVVNPKFDYVPPELVSLFVTNFGGYHPSYIYRLLTQYYHPDDKHL